jgi:hypothetical protein
METTKIGVLNCELVFQEQTGEKFRDLIWHPGTIVEVHDFDEGDNIYYKVERLHYQESPGVRVYYNDKVKFSMIHKHRISLMWVEDIKWKNIVFSSLGIRWIKER